ncbi:MAG: MMPL family transporter, partial [Candidatus Kariarchaeaceae archaeon]
MSRYLESVIKHRYPISVVLIIVFIIFLPVGFNSFDYIAPEFGLEDLGTDQGVFTFSSLTDDIILLVDGDENIISDEFQNWTSSFVFDIQNRPVFQQYAQDGTPIEHIFSVTSDLLRPYYVNLHAIVGFVNVTSYIILEGTRLLHSAWNEQVLNSGDTNVSLAYESMIGSFTQQFTQLAYGQLYVDFSAFWFDRLVLELSGSTPDIISYDDLILLYSQNSSNWVPSTYEGVIRDGIEFLLASFSTTTSWSKASLLPITSQYLFGLAESEYIDFLDHVFMDGSSATRAIQLAREDRLPFLRNEIDIPGIPDRIREFFLTALTNSNGETVPTSIMIRFKLRSDLNETELSEVFDDIKSLVEEYRSGLPSGYDIAFLSFLNYQLERSEAISEEMHRVDLFAVIIGFLVLVVLIRNPLYSALIIALAWSTTQVTRGVLVSLTPLIGTFNGTSFSITTTFLLGAAMNYVVFFVFRYIQEKKNESDHPVIASTRTAVHSVIISGIAITLAMVPYLWSDVQLLNELSKSLIPAMITQTLLLSHTLPVVFGLLDSLQTIRISNFTPNALLFSFHLSRVRVTRIIYGSVVLLLISGIIIGVFSTSFATNDFIAESGETGRSFEILDSSYPENYLSKYLITINTTHPVIVDGVFSIPGLEALNELSETLASQPGVEYVVSVAWPL